MTAASLAREAKRKDGELISYKMNNVLIPKGALVSINAAGYATNATDAAGETFAGVAYETVDNSAGAVGACEIRVLTTGTFVFVDGGGNGAITDVGVQFNIVDNQTITDAATTNSLKAGVCVESIDANTVRVRIDRFAG
jgi:3D (Asp-Asp-Asp) domain-containing protein